MEHALRFEGHLLIVRFKDGREFVLDAAPLRAACTTTRHACVSALAAAARSDAEHLSR